MKGKRKRQVAFWLDDEHVKKLTELAKATQASQTEVIRTLLDMAYTRTEWEQVEHLALGGVVKKCSG